MTIENGGKSVLLSWSTAVGCPGSGRSGQHGHCCARVSISRLNLSCHWVWEQLEIPRNAAKYGLNQASADQRFSESFAVAIVSNVPQLQQDCRRTECAQHIARSLQPACSWDIRSISRPGVTTHP